LAAGMSGSGWAVSVPLVPAVALVTAKGDMKGTMADLESLNNINKQTHWDCDFLTQNFETRQEARAQEIEALSQSVAMLSGAK
jgi:hypothetical protein